MEKAYKLQELTIDEDFQNMIPPLTAEERRTLEETILNDGRIYFPIIVWNGTIIDGHNRYEILKEHPQLQYEIQEKEFASREEALVWICKNQLGRRNLSDVQKLLLIGRQYEAEKNARGGKRDMSHNENGQFTAKCHSDNLRSENTSQRERCGLHRNGEALVSADHLPAACREAYQAQAEGFGGNRCNLPGNAPP